MLIFPIVSYQAIPGFQVQFQYFFFNWNTHPKAAPSVMNAKEVPAIVLKRRMSSRLSALKPPDKCEMWYELRKRKVWEVKNVT